MKRGAWQPGLLLLAKNSGLCVSGVLSLAQKIFSVETRVSRGRVAARWFLDQAEIPWKSLYKHAQNGRRLRVARSVAGLIHVWARTRHSSIAHVNRKDWTHGTGNLPRAPLMARGSVGTAHLAAKRTKETKGTGSGE